MVTTIVFWNTLHLSNRTDEIERYCARELDSGRAKARRGNARRKRMGGGPITRGKFRSFKAGNSSKSKGPKGIQKPIHHTKPNRAERAEMRDIEANDRAQRIHRRYRRKLAYAKDLPRRNDYVFYSEVMPSYPNWQSPLAAGAGHTPNTLGYYFAHNNVGGALPLCPISNGDIPPPSKPISRRPKGVVINGVHFFFWHAKAKASYANVVAEVFTELHNWLHPTPFVLLGDLNALPSKVSGHGVPINLFLKCGSATHQGGKELDYAITNVPGRFSGSNCEKYNNLSPGNFKDLTGSDHVPMILRLK
ncbi:MAG: hypothetical protein Rhims3KO_02770 [Hyphomicrobiales bacterium]